MWSRGIVVATESCMHFFLKKRIKLFRRIIVRIFTKSILCWVVGWAKEVDSSWTEAILSARTFAASKRFMNERCHIWETSRRSNIKLKWNKKQSKKRDEKKTTTTAPSWALAHGWITTKCTAIEWIATGHYLWCYVFAFEHQVSNICSMVARDSIFFLLLLLFHRHTKNWLIFLRFFPPLQFIQQKQQQRKSTR